MSRISRDGQSSSEDEDEATPARGRSNGQAKSRRKGGAKQRMALTRTGELYVAVGSEVRLLDLAAVKAASRETDEGSMPPTPGSGARQHALPDYKVLDAKCVGYPIQALVLNPTHKLLAVVGTTKLSVIVLPRRGGTTASRVPVKALPVGAYYHGLAGSSRLAQVAWHPAADGADCLLALTVDGTLREYSLGYDAEEPAQSISFSAASASGKRRRGFGLASEDEKGQQAVAFAVGDGNGWCPLTMYGLLRNGDVLSVCPFLPKKALLKKDAIDLLSAHSSGLLSSEADARSTDPVTPQRPGARFVTDGTPTPSTSSTITPEFAQAQKYIASLLRQASGALPGEVVKVAPPTAFASTPALRQGPYLLQPAPEELEDGLDEAGACSLLHLPPSQQDGGPPMLLVAFQDGRVDALLELEPPLPRWAGGSPGEAPALLVYEQIDLGLPAALREAGRPVNRTLKDGWVGLHPDALYPHDTVYVSHPAGGSCVFLSELRAALASALAGGEANVGRVQVAWVCKTLSPGFVQEDEENGIEGVCVAADAYLGYELLLLPAHRGALGIELSLRSSSAGAVQKDEKGRKAIEGTAYDSLLSSAFEVPALLSAPSPVPRLAAPPLQSQGQITPATLRYFAQTVESFRRQLRDVAGAADEVAVRMDLQRREVARQLAKLAELDKLASQLRRGTTAPPSTQPAAGGKLARLQEAQAELARRADRVLQRLVEASSPELSAGEVAWFAELAALAERVEGEGGLAPRALQAEERLDLLRPQVAERAPEGRMGIAQIQTVESRLRTEELLIKEAGRKVDRLREGMSRLAV